MKIINFIDLGVRHFKAGSGFVVAFYGLRILPHSYGVAGQKYATVRSQGFYLVAPTRWGKGIINSSLI